MRICSRCENEPARPGQRWGKSCHAEYMRGWRVTNPLTDEQKVKSNARSYLNTYISRGRIQRQPCERCGVFPVEGHHPDYSKPLEVVWLCKHHHQEHHR